MTKQVIQGDGPTHADFPTEVHVSWQKDHNYVAVATVLPGAGLVGRGGERIDTAGVEPGWWVEYTKDGLDELIETLTHARRKAFGKVSRPRQIIRETPAQMPSGMVDSLLQAVDVEPDNHTNTSGTLSRNRRPIPPSEDLSGAASSL